MATEPSPLGALRSEIDEIDAEIQTLLTKRAGVVDRVGRAKSGANPMRPGREAMLLRRRLEAASEKMPTVVISRIWREIIAAFCRAQGPLSVAVCAPEKSVGYWDLARDHFGSATPMSLHKSPRLVVQAVGAGEVSVGLMPVPQEDDPEPWWRHLVGAGPDRPRVIARLPFCENPEARFEDLEALAIAMLDYDASGDDVSLLAVPASDRMSRASFNALVREAGFDGRAVAAFDESGTEPGRLYLVEVSGYVEAGDPRMKGLEEKLGDQGGEVFHIGGYAKPIEGDS